jgi:hypothetical protein
MKTEYEYNLEHYKGTSKAKVIAELTFEKKYILELLKEGQQLKDENAELKDVISYLKNEVRLWIDKKNSICEVLSSK